MPMLPKNSEYWRLIKNNKKADKKSKICISCKDNNTGWCTKFKSWCSHCNEQCIKNV